GWDRRGSRPRGQSGTPRRRHARGGRPTRRSRGGARPDHGGTGANPAPLRPWCDVRPRAGRKAADGPLRRAHPLAGPPRRARPLVSEAVRGAGAILVDPDARRFPPGVDARAELASRAVVAPAVAAADAGGGAWLDARHIADFAEQFPGVTAMLRRHGLDPSRDRIPVAPALHYAMGGIGTDLDGRSSRPGLWAVGEVACTGGHG